MNEQQQKEQIALFRYSILAPVITGQVKNISEYFRQQACKIHQVPFYGPKEYLPKTFVTWLSNYRRFGFDGLKPRARNDKGSSRALTRDTEEYILNLRKLRMDMPLTLFYDELLANGELSKNEASFATIYRLLKRNGLVKKSVNPQPERKRFSHEQVNFLWQEILLMARSSLSMEKRDKPFSLPLSTIAPALLPQQDFSQTANLNPCGRC